MSRPPNDGRTPAERSTPTSDEPATTIDRHRIDIDRGVTGDKVPFPDPAAAPLGTDEEAGGSPASAGPPAPALSEPAPGDADAKTMSGEPRDRSHRSWMPHGLLLLGVAALLVAILG
ncbi:hypothetical protein [Niveispirillum sp. KHB5.9]|uniref:hypothetical protein n=1 Tax=Niveispirillum sp. KHB5.9 TaxID=3400269 RepID=UPI003A8AF23C